VTLRARPARPEDADDLAPRLRAADLREIRAAAGRPPLDVLRYSLERSAPALAVMDGGGALVALYGAAPDGTPDGGLVWLLGADTLTRHSFTFLRHARPHLDDLHQAYPRLWNWVDARNRVHIRWLRWCGFSRVGFDPEHGAERRPFHRFERRGMRVAPA
jgi:hypothetical protein